jgi:hypothetical protein
MMPSTRSTQGADAAPVRERHDPSSVSGEARPRSAYLCVPRRHPVAVLLVPARSGPASQHATTGDLGHRLHERPTYDPMTERRVANMDRGGWRECAPPPYSYVNANTASASHRRNESLSLNCLKSSVSSLSTAVITRPNALSCSMRAFWRSECRRAFL